jgi:hypothetical protein
MKDVKTLRDSGLNSHFRVYLRLFEKYEHSERIDYNILQFLGDTGALYGVLLQIGWTLLSVTKELTLNLDGFLTKRVFSRDHTLRRYPSGLYSLLEVVCRCKYTWYRRMAKVADRRI